MHCIFGRRNAATSEGLATVVPAGPLGPIPQSLEELRQSFITRGYTFDQIEMLNDNLKNVNSKEQALAVLSDPTTMQELGPVHLEVVDLITKLRSTGPAIIPPKGASANL